MLPKLQDSRGKWTQIRATLCNSGWWRQGAGEWDCLSGLVRLSRRIYDYVEGWYLVSIDSWERQNLSAQKERMHRPLLWHSTFTELRRLTNNAVLSCIHKIVKPFKNSWRNIWNEGEWASVSFDSYIDSKMATKQQIGRMFLKDAFCIHSERFHLRLLSRLISTSWLFLRQNRKSFPDGLPSFTEARMSTGIWHLSDSNLSDDPMGESPSG